MRGLDIRTRLILDQFRAVELIFEARFYLGSRDHRDFAVINKLTYLSDQGSRTLQLVVVAVLVVSNNAGHYYYIVVRCTSPHSDEAFAS